MKLACYNELTNQRRNSSLIDSLDQYIDARLPMLNSIVDGEDVDAMEHFFWGLTNGIAMELGALDGTHDTMSMTKGLEQVMGWKRILIEGNPAYWPKMKTKSPKAYAVGAAVCETARQVHYVSADYVGGIVEFMSEAFFAGGHLPRIRAAIEKAGGVEAVDWGQFDHVHRVPCVPLAQILQAAAIRHVNFFILDVEGGELGVLRSIDWTATAFDVLCVEIDPRRRPPGYADQVTRFLAERGYVAATGVLGRNTCKWGAYLGLMCMNVYV